MINSLPTSKIPQNNSKCYMENLNISSETTSNLLPLRHPKSTYIPQVWPRKPFESKRFNNALLPFKIPQNNSKCYMENLNISSETTSNLLPLRHPKSTYIPQVWPRKPFESKRFNNALLPFKIPQNNSKCYMENLNISSETTFNLLPLRHPKSTYIPQVWLWELFES
ncbi:unnamed protein product [Orchesella dallaii]|uniref:Uncharacterized protein n=1 Tax=Orchesella dallaii TaxID=48710 RepID=A0ABP1Q3T7_9HEXA